MVEYQNIKLIMADTKSILMTKFILLSIITTKIGTAKEHLYNLYLVWINDDITMLITQICQSRAKNVCWKFY